MEGILMKGTFDNGSQGREGICKECEKGTQEGIVCGCQERGCNEWCEVREKVILSLRITVSTRSAVKEYPTSAMRMRFSTQVPNSLPAMTPSNVSARSTTRLACVSRDLRFQVPRISAYPRCASLKVARIT